MQERLFSGQRAVQTCAAALHPPWQASCKAQGAQNWGT